MAKGDDIQDRLIEFAVLIIHLTAKLPKTPAGKHIAGQLLRSGTSPAPNYAEARAAESANDFIHKLKIALKELNETIVWIQIAKRSRLINEDDITATYNECKELSRILNASIRTVIQKRPKIVNYQ